MINISTDKAVRPTSILGISKRIAEIICHSYSFKTKSKIDPLNFFSKLSKTNLAPE